MSRSSSEYDIKETYAIVAIIVPFKGISINVEIEIIPCNIVFPFVGVKKSLDLWQKNLFYPFYKFPLNATIHQFFINIYVIPRHFGKSEHRENNVLSDEVYVFN